MAAIHGKWRVTGTTNLEAYHSAIHSSEEYKDKLRTIAAEVKKNPDAYIEDVAYDSAAGTVQRIVYFNGEKKRETKYKVGSETDVTSADGRSVKVTVQVVNDNKIIIHEKGDAFEVTGTLEAKGGELSLTLIGNGVTATQNYVKAN